jgi:hypothetical protein
MAPDRYHRLPALPLPLQHVWSKSISRGGRVGSAKGRPRAADRRVIEDGPPSHGSRRGQALRRRAAKAPPKEGETASSHAARS